MCSKDASVHLTQIVNNKIHKVDLCESCAKKKGVTDPEGFSLADLFAKKPKVVDSKQSKLECPTCGLSTADFRSNGRFGCEDCYDAFKPLLASMLEDMHEGITHKGKIPTIALSRRSSQLQLKELQDFLAKAIAEEAYEEAAKYRDQIRELEGTKNLEVS